MCTVDRKYLHAGKGSQIELECTCSVRAVIDVYKGITNKSVTRSMALRVLRKMCARSVFTVSTADTLHVLECVCSVHRGALQGHSSSIWDDRAFCQVSAHTDLRLQYWSPYPTV